MSLNRNEIARSIYVFNSLYLLFLDFFRYIFIAAVLIKCVASSAAIVPSPGLTWTRN
jgi:hypothetical protein